MRVKEPKMRLRYVVYNAVEDRTQTFVMADDGRSEKDLMRLVERSIKMLCRGGAPVRLVKMCFEEIPPKRLHPTKRDKGKNKDKSTEEKGPVLRISVANAARFTSIKVAEELAEYLAEAPDEQARIDEVLFMLRFVLLVRNGKDVVVRKDLKREDFEALLAQIYDREVWSEAMIAAYWEIRLLFSKRKCDRKAIKDKFQQEVARVNAERGTAYFTKQGQFVEEPAVRDGIALVQLIKEFVHAAMHQEELGGYYELNFD